LQAKSGAFVVSYKRGEGECDKPHTRMWFVVDRKGMKVAIFYLGEGRGKEDCKIITDGNYSYINVI
jgi:hypothetical protein